ncbi:MAG: thioredoxin family protein [Bacteroidetes bacterium]|nr:thioredoxin family protein [Bacteroidota bacterium]
MKLTVIFTFLILFSVTTVAQNKKIKDTKTSAPMLIGEINRQAFQDSVFSWWFNSEYQMYEVDSTSLKSDADKLRNYDITLVLGTWCSDSRREVPRFLKILDYLNYPKDKIKIYAVDRSKKGLNNEIDSLNIQKVPTIIFYKNNKETGRIIEEPKVTLEKDLANIVTKK